VVSWKRNRFQIGDNNIGFGCQERFIRRPAQDPHRQSSTRLFGHNHVGRRIPDVDNLSGKKPQPLAGILNYFRIRFRTGHLIAAQDDFKKLRDLQEFKNRASAPVLIVREAGDGNFFAFQGL